VNSDGDTPRDIAEDDEVLELLQGAIESQGMMLSYVVLLKYPGHEAYLRILFFKAITY